MNRAKKKLFALILFILSILFIPQLSCSSPTDPPIEENIPTTEAIGPGGSAYMYGYIKDFVHPSKSVSNTHIYIMNQQDYNDTIIHIFINSTDASFKITEMPEGVYDLIFMNDNYLCAKIGKLIFKPSGNTFNNPNSGGYFIDSTIYITDIADSIGRPDAPPFGLQGYGPTITVHLKSETADSIGWQIIQGTGCDTLRVDRYDDPVFDPFENDVYNLHCGTIINVKESLVFFNWQIYFRIAGPDYTVIEQ